MAGKFPIEYAETLPTGRAAVVRADIDVRTGAEEEARALAHLGGALYGVGLKIHNANKAMELSTFRRKEEEFRLGALQALKASGFDVNNDEAVTALRDRTNADRDSLISKWGSVNNAYQIYRNDIDPQWDIDFNGEILNIKGANVKDEFNLNAENLLGKGKMFEYQTLLETALATEVITKAEYEFYTKSAPNDSILQQMRIQIGNNNPQIVIELSEQMTDPTADQMEFRDRLLNAAGRQNTAQDRVDEEWTGKFSERLRFLLEPDQGEPPTFEEIDQSPMSVEAKDKMRTKLRVFDNYSEGELKEAFTDKGEVLAEIYDEIDKGLITSAAQITERIGQGLHPVTAEGIIKDIREPYKKDTEQMFRRIFGWSPELGFADDMAPFLYEKTLREWNAEIKKQDVVGDKIIEIGRAIVRPYFAEHIERTMPVEEDIPRIMELALGEPEEIEEELLPEIPPIEEEPYKVGETRADEKGQLWEYMGGNKWRKK